MVKNYDKYGTPEEIIEKIKNGEGEDLIEKAFNVLVPQSGKADTLAGELVRAINRILYRDYNDGDKFYEGYGLETCGDSVLFIMDETEDSKFNFPEAFEDIANNAAQDTDDTYTNKIKEIGNELIEYITIEKPELLITPNTKDSRDMSISTIKERLDYLIPKYDLEIEFPDSLQEAYNKDYINNDDIESLIRDNIDFYNSGSEIGINIEYSNIYLFDLESAVYEELDHNLYNWLEEYGNEVLRDNPEEDEDENDDINEEIDPINNTIAPSSDPHLEAIKNIIKKSEIRRPVYTAYSEEPDMKIFPLRYFNRNICSSNIKVLYPKQLYSEDKVQKVKKEIENYITENNLQDLFKLEYNEDGYASSVNDYAFQLKLNMISKINNYRYKGVE